MPTLTHDAPALPAITDATLARVADHVDRRVEPHRFAVVNDDHFTWMPDRSVDLVLTDPPYNISQDTRFHTYQGNAVHSYRFDRDSGWDSSSPEAFRALIQGWAGEFARVLRPGGGFGVFCADAYTSHWWDALRSAGLSPKRVVTWRKPNAVPVNRRFTMLSSCEYAVVGTKGGGATFNADIDLQDAQLLSQLAPVWLSAKAADVVEQAVRDALRRLPEGSLAEPGVVADAVSAAVTGAAQEAGRRARKMFVAGEGRAPCFRGCVPNHIALNSRGGQRRHPTEKPVALLAYLASLLSNPGDIILDPFAGSGSTGEAALSLGRQVVLVEQEELYFSSIIERLQPLAD